MAAPAWLIATPDEAVRAGAPIVLDVVKPATHPEWPEKVGIRLLLDDQIQELMLFPIGPVAANDIRRTYRGVLPIQLSGLLRIDIAGVESNRLALLVSAPDAIEQMQLPTKPLSPHDASGDWLFPVNEPVLSANEPMYFVIGGNGGLSARFQLSFKYRLFDSDSSAAVWMPQLSNMYFAYTQNSIWDLGANSAPFRDTSYRPSFFWQGASRGENGRPSLLRVGYEHESNGKDGADSRSINTLFAQPIWRTQFADGRALIAAPKIYGYLGKSDNPDIHRYRGYLDWSFRYGREDGWLLGAQLRYGTAGHGSALIDFSYPLREPLLARTGGFVHFQVFSGYGESLLDYNRDRGVQARVGIFIVR